MNTCTQQFHHLYILQIDLNEYINVYDKQFFITMLFLSFMKDTFEYKSITYIIYVHFTFMF